MANKRFTQNKDAVSARFKKIFLFFLLGTITALAPMTTDIYLPSFPVLTADFNTNPSLTQLSLTTSFLGIAFGQLLFGPISDVRGRRIPLIVALTIYAASSLLCALAPTIWTFIILRFIQGLSGAGGIVIARACIRDLYSGSELTKMYAALMLVLGIAPVLAPIIGGQLIAYMPWNGLFILLAIIGLVLTFAVTFGLPETLSNHQRLQGGLGNSLRTFKGLLSDRIFLGYALTQGLFYGSLFAYISGSSFAYQVIFGISAQGYGLFFGVNAVGLVIASQIAGRLAGKIPETRLLIFGLGYAIVGGISLMTVILTGAGLIVFALSLFLCISSIGIISTSCFPLAMQSQGGNAGSASALLGVLQFTIGGLVAPLVGLGGSDTAVPMGIAIVLSQLSAIIVYLSLVHHAKSSNKQTESKEVSM